MKNINMHQTRSHHFKNPDEAKEKSLGIILYNPKIIIPGTH